MSKKNQYSNDDMFMEQPELGYYSFPPMFRCECDEPNLEPIADENRAEPATPLPINPEDSFIDPSLTNIAYTQAFLKSLIGKRVRVTFLIGTTNLTDRTGILVNVGVSYIVIKQPESGAHIMCDLYSIKFVDYFD